MTGEKTYTDILNLFKDTVSPEEAICAGLDAKISSDITEIRLSRNMTQKEFAKAVGVTQSLVSRWESGTCNYNIATLAKIISALNLECRISIYDPKTRKPNIAPVKLNTWNPGGGKSEKYERSRVFTIVKEG